MGRLKRHDGLPCAPRGYSGAECVRMLQEEADLAGVNGELWKRRTLRRLAKREPTRKKGQAA
jgi:hypothetical protein